MVVITSNIATVILVVLTILSGWFTSILLSIIHQNMILVFITHILTLFIQQLIFWDSKERNGLHLLP